MNIAMSGIDYSLAQIDTRQKFSFTKARQAELYDILCAQDGIEGCVLLATCNRTEIYLSCADGFDPEPFELLCSAAGADYAQYRQLHFTRRADEALTHLCLLACGAKSQIWGEDQILTQVKEAVAYARECHAADSVLEVMFRTAVTCGKRIKTELNMARRETSVADQLLCKLTEYPDARSVLVIGNGEIGRLAAAALAANGYRTAMTIRQYRHKQVIIPPGVEGFEYDERYDRLGDFDAVVSATRSPHFTIEAARVAALENHPSLYFDLAVPRDIETAVGKLKGAQLFDVDTLSQGGEDPAHGRILGEIGEYVEKYKADFYKWCTYRTGETRKSHFPLFVDIRGKTALVVGGGKIALRRVTTLRKFDFQIVVVARKAADELKKIAKKEAIVLHERPFEDADADGVFLAVAATNDRELNRHIGELVKTRGGFVSVADCAEECSFYFPAVIDRGRITVALGGDGRDHHALSAQAKKIREFYCDED